MRKKRDYSPGTAFHITARIIHQHRWFDEAARSEVVDILTNVQPRSDADLLAYAIMPNHLHLVVVQGVDRLGDLMQPLQCRIARMLQRRRCKTGHVFERRYYAKPCIDVQHLRNAIVYTHNNPGRANLCKDLRAYEWTSHRLYCGMPDTPRKPTIAVSLDLFADQPNESRKQLVNRYCQFIAWRQQCDRIQAKNATALLPSPPCTRHGNMSWQEYTGRSFTSFDRTRDEPPGDLRDFVRRALNELAPGYTVDELRVGGRARSISQLRRELIERACKAGYTGSQIAHHLRLTESYVSQLNVGIRMSRYPTSAVPNEKAS